ncbi:MAG TPA: alkaline phosphatase family protein [Streptosporangiaceae bacterium]|nr:alkaline phosphatase family protein [Streptosporangiaceae bacterium]
MRFAMRTAGLAAALTTITLAAGLAPATGTARAPGITHPADDLASLGAHRIQHVIEIMLENHTYANLFPVHVRRRHAKPRAIRAPANEGDVQGGISNSRAAELRAMHYRPGKGYLMNGYTKPPYGSSAVTTFGPRFDPDLRYLARKYESGTRNFQPAIAPTRPNVMMALNATAHGWYYNRRNPHPAPWYSIFDELTQYRYTWKIYLGLPTWLHPRQSWYQLVPRRHRSDVTTASQFFTDLSAGTLPRFSFVRPGFGYSEEPLEDIAEGDAWLGQLVQAVARSRYWKSTAIFLTYDEGGGFWDPVPPPAAGGYGTRTPMVIVSPWARRGAYTRRTTNISILSFMQHLWGMAALNGLNAAQNDLASAFDFRQRPLPRPRPPVAPSATIGFHGASLASEVRVVHPHDWLRIYLDAETTGLSLSGGISGPVSLSLSAPAGVRHPASFPARTELLDGRAMIRVRFNAPGYYRVTAAGPDGSIGWTTLVVLPAHRRPSPATAGFPRTGM